MGRAARASKGRVCKACKQSFYGDAEAILEHGRTCARMEALGLVTPGLVTGQAAVDVLNQAKQHAERRRKPRWG